MSYVVARLLVFGVLLALLLQTQIRQPLTHLLLLWRRRSIILTYRAKVTNFILFRHEKSLNTMLFATNYDPIIQKKKKEHRQIYIRFNNIFDIYLLLIFAAVLSIVVLKVNILITLPLGLILITLLVFDLRWFWLPDRLTVPLSIVGLFVGWVNGQLQISFLGLLILTLLFLAIRYSYKVARGIEGLGLGDVKLAAAMGAWLGPVGALHAILTASVVGIVAILSASHFSGVKLHGRYRLPFGAFLSIGFWVIWCLRQAPSF